MRVDAIQVAIGNRPQIDLPLTHRFTPGLYIREMRMPAGTLMVTKIHKSEHPLLLTQGCASFWSEETGVQNIEAPYVGITRPGTRRVWYAHSDCILMTFHPTQLTDPDAIEREIILERPLTPELEAAAQKLLEDCRDANA